MILMAVDDLPAQEEQWALEARQGSRSALEELHRRFEPRIRKICRSMIPAEADDVAQEIFLRVCREIGRYDPSRRFKAWIFAVARNVVVDHLRRRGKWWDIEKELRPDVAETSADPLLRTESQERIRHALERLPEPYRMVVVSTIWDDLTPSEIAEALDVPAGRVRVQLFRALKLLAEELKEA